MIKNILKRTIVSILTWEARMVLARYKPKIIAVTGSVGKTSTKDAIFSVVGEYFYAAKSAKSYNSEIGVPLAILGLQTAWGNPLLWLKNIVFGVVPLFVKTHYPRWFVLEAGIDRPDDMKRLTEWMRPDIACMTYFAETPPHVEFFPDKDALYAEKWRLAERVASRGVIVANADDPIMMEYARKVDRSEKKIVTFGILDNADVRGSNINIFYGNKGDISVPTGVTFKVDYDGKSVPIKIHGVLGDGYVYAALCAIAVGTACDINLVKVASALTNYETPPGRMKLVPGLKDSTIIDDSYNASPDAMRVAIATLSKLEAPGKRIAVLGDMLELGKFTVTAHRKIGEQLPENIDLLYLVGPRAKFIGEAVKRKVLPKGKVKYFSTPEEAGSELQNVLEKGDVVLVKGSQGIRLEKCVEEIMAEPERKKALLVRQDDEWNRR